VALFDQINLNQQNKIKYW